MLESLIYHYTDDDGYKAISSQVRWVFKALQPPGDHERGAYFTTLRPTDNRFSARTRIPKAKQKFFFAFVGTDGLRPRDGGRGAYIWWSPDDYVVDEGRQRYHESTERMP